jgi:hypothetical protein
MTFDRLVLTLVATIVLLSPPAMGRRRVPPTAELDGCVMPAEACASVRDIVQMRVGGRKIEFAVEHLSFPTSGASGTKVLTELKLRGVNVQGPKELTEKLTTGASLRVRGLLRTGPFLMLQSVEPRSQK